MTADKAICSFNEHMLRFGLSAINNDLSAFLWAKVTQQLPAFGLIYVKKTIALNCFLDVARPASD
ncbi:hypothetical protein [Bradyrhizobium algeriense]|uniref:hypothetical protein n=1 Tax=Bradyrhizobium algeriense TaxID=634784 RepID=UPI000D3B6500|nr:hypothetical protein [Bradyrhizobium algeriense]